MPGRTEHTITTPERLRDAVRQIQRDRYSLDEQKIEIGLCCVAAPIFKTSGRVVGSISIVGRTSA